MGSIPRLWRFPWRRKWQPTPVFLPGESHGQRSLMGYSPWGPTSQTWFSDCTIASHALVVLWPRFQALATVTSHLLGFLRWPLSGAWGFPRAGSLAVCLRLGTSAGSKPCSCGRGQCFGMYVMKSYCSCWSWWPKQTRQARPDGVEAFGPYSHLSWKTMPEAVLGCVCLVASPRCPDLATHRPRAVVCPYGGLLKG